MKKYFLLIVLIGLILSLPIVATAQKERVVRIDCSGLAPMIDSGWKLTEENQKNEAFEFSLSNVKLVSCGSRENKISGKTLLNELKEKAFSSYLLDFLLKNQSLIPAEWQGKTIIFFGTTYWDSSTPPILAVLNMKFYDGAWESGTSYIDDNFDGGYAIVKAN